MDHSPTHSRILLALLMGMLSVPSWADADNSVALVVMVGVGLGLGLALGSFIFGLIKKALAFMVLGFLALVGILATAAFLIF